MVQVLQIVDAGLILLAFWLAAEVRRVFFVRLSGGENDLSAMSWVLYIAVPITPLVLEHFEFYSRIRQKRWNTVIWELVKGLLTLGLLVGIFSLFAKLVDARRLIITFGILFSFVLLFFRHCMTRRLMRRGERAEDFLESVVIAGQKDEITALVDELDDDIRQQWKIVDRFDLENRSVEEFYEVLVEKSVGRVFFATKNIEFESVAKAVEVCELQGVEAWIAASFIRTQIARPVFDVVGHKPMLVLRSTPELSWELMLKDLIDRVGAGILILFSLPFWIVAIIGIRLQSPGAPVFFSQKRAGIYGRPFRMWKFRTMVPNAEELLAKVKSELGNQMDGPVFKLDHDPRVFPFGALLRKLSIDELPQLLNVFLGDMSLVGPRPLPLYEVAAFRDISHRRRLSMKPGITCFWQAGGRNQISSFEEWVELDLKYIDNWSLWLDFKILLMTVPAVLFGKGAK